MTTPTPGSEAAVESGCTCPVLDNHHGKGFLLDGAPVFWINAGCPLHAKRKEAHEPVNRRSKRNATKRS